MASIKRDSMDATSADLSAKLKATTLSTQPPPTSKSQLTTLPRTILNTILSHLLDIEVVNTGKPNVSYTHSLQSSGTLLFKASRSPFPISPSLFYVSKKVSEVARQYFYAQNLFVRFEMRSPDARHVKTMLLDSGILFSVCTPAVLRRVTQNAMDLTLIEKESEKTRAVVVFPTQYLPRLVNFMDQAAKASKSWAKEHRLELCVKNTYDFRVSRLQGDLLEPFRFLAGFSSVVVSPTHLLSGYAEGLEKGMTSANFNVADWLSTVEAIGERGDRKNKEKEWEESRQQYETVIIALTYAYLTHPEDIHSQDEAFAKRIQHLRWRSEFGIGHSLLSQHRSTNPHTSSSSPTTLKWANDPKIARDLLTAETSLSSALSLVTNSPSPTSNPWLATLPVDLVPPNSETWFTDAERGETWFELGLAHAALEEFLFAAGDMERAVRLLGTEISQEVESVFEWVRGRIDWEKRPGEGLKKAGRVAKRIGM